MPTLAIPPAIANCRPPMIDTNIKQNPKPARAPPTMELIISSPCLSKKTIPAINITAKIKSTSAIGSGLDLVKKILKSPSPISTRNTPMRNAIVRVLTKGFSKTD
jgi:hypothetical protein